MKAGILCIGDELLIGQTVNTNASWIGEHLAVTGVDVFKTLVVQDKKDCIVAGVDDLLREVDVLLITGGLGPTKDDKTKIVLTEYFNTNLVFDEHVFEFVQQVFTDRGIEMPEINREQAMVPQSCEPILNPFGTAPGMVFKEGNKLIVSMPGVPFEMKAMMTDHIIPLLQRSFELPNVCRKTVLTHGIGESSLLEKIQDWEHALEKDDVELAYLPSFGGVKLRLTSYSETKEKSDEKLEGWIEKLKAKIPEHFFGYEGDVPEKVLGKMLTENEQTIAIAESCTGGYIAHLITSVSGSSKYFIGSVVAYSNHVKQKLLGVKEADLKSYGAVSEQVVKQMAKGVRENLEATYGVATSGVAGPDGGTKDKPVGTVWVAISTPERTRAEKFSFGKHREKNIKKAAIQGLTMIIKEISERG